MDRKKYERHKVTPKVLLDIMEDNAIMETDEQKKQVLLAKYEGAKEMYDMFHRRDTEYREMNREKYREYQKTYKRKKRGNEDEQYTGIEQ